VFPARARGWIGAFLAAALAAACSSAPPPKTAPAPAVSCHGTLGLEVGPLTRSVRKKLGLPADVKGAVVTSVSPGGPAANAGIRPNDVLERIGDAAIVFDCDADKADYNRACEPVRVVLRRGGDAVEVTLVPVDQMAFLEKACDGGNSNACFRAAWLRWDRRHENARTLELLGSACKAGSGEACAYEGLQLSENPERVGESLPVLERACELRSGGGCATLGFLYATGKAVARDDKRAAVLYRKSCELGDAQGCYNAGLMADDGRGVKEDAARAAAEYDEACELGSSTACTNLGFLYERGRGVRQDRARAFALYERGCAGSSCLASNLGGCLNVGRAYRDGIGVAVDEAKAAAIFREACDRKVNQDDVHAAENGARACSLLGGLYMSGEGIPKDLEKGRELSVLGCERGDSFGCFNAAVCFSSGADANPAQAASYFERACKLGDGESCHQLATAYRKGDGVGRDAQRAKALEKQACDLGFKASCGKK
jgi:TPR repeat protein